MRAVRSLKRMAVVRARSKAVRAFITQSRMSRGMSESDARALIVSGFASPVSKELPLEYAAEMNNLIKLEMETG